MRYYNILIIIYIRADVIGGKPPTPIVWKAWTHSHLQCLFQIQNDPELKNKLKAQALIYPESTASWCLCAISPRMWARSTSAMESGNQTWMPIFHPRIEQSPRQWWKIQHMPHGSMHLFKLVNWSTFLPEEYKKNHVYTESILGRLNPSYSILLDTRLSPLINDSRLQNLPLTFPILTCQHDILEMMDLCMSHDLNVGVKVFHDHMGMESWSFIIHGLTNLLKTRH